MQCKDDFAFPWEHANFDPSNIQPSTLINEKVCMAAYVGIISELSQVWLTYISQESLDTHVKYTFLGSAFANLFFFIPSAGRTAQPIFTLYGPNNDAVLPKQSVF
jgi:hypothetical protein